MLKTPKENQVLLQLIQFSWRVIKMPNGAWPVDSEDTITFWRREGFEENIFYYGANILESGDILLLELSSAKTCKIGCLCCMD